MLITRDKFLTDLNNRKILNILEILFSIEKKNLLKT